MEEKSQLNLFEEKENGESWRISEKTTSNKLFQSLLPNLCPTS